MALDIEGIVGGGMGGEKALDGTLRFEPLPFALPPPDRQVRVFGGIVFSQR